MRIFVLVLDGVGLQAVPGFRLPNGARPATLPHLAARQGGLRLPFLEALGLGKLASICGVSPDVQPWASYGVLTPRSPAQDTLTGHRELFGAPRETPPPVYPEGFPEEIVRALESLTGRGFLGNRPASGTQIIQELGAEHLRTGKLILYTSADSVLQIACHDAVLPIPQLHALCERIHEANLRSGWVDRVIARPFTGRVGAFARIQKGRKDWTRPADRPTLLDAAKEAGYAVIGVGKVPDIFGGRGFTEEIPAADNREVFRALEGLAREPFQGIAVLNFNDFDTLYGHRNDPLGFAAALEEWDAQMRRLLAHFGQEDLLIFTADHGNDPTVDFRDHTREEVFLLAYRPGRKGRFVGRRPFGDLAVTLADLMGLSARFPGKSFRERLP